MFGNDEDRDGDETENRLYSGGDSCISVEGVAGAAEYQCPPSGLSGAQLCPGLAAAVEGVDLRP